MPASTGRQSVSSGRHAPEGQAIWTVLLQLPVPSQVGVMSVSIGHDAGPHTVPRGCEPATTQVAVPVSHETLPTSHGFDSVQVPPAVHAPHVPP